MPYSNRHLMVSGLFGPLPRRLHPAPKGTKSVFFSNDAGLKPEAREKGWNFRLVDTDRLPLTDDSRISSIQSKYVKFLQFFDDFPDLRAYDFVTYCDHKPRLETVHLLWFFTRLEQGKELIIRSSPKPKGIPQEIQQATGQLRYAHSMPETIEWLRELKKTQPYSDEVQIANTGIIHCTNIPRFRPLFDQVYKAVVDLGQPECQILWAALAQPYQDYIQQIDWYDIKVHWRAP